MRGQGGGEFREEEHEGGRLAVIPGAAKWEQRAEPFHCEGWVHVGRQRFQIGGAAPAEAGTESLALGALGALAGEAELEGEAGVFEVGVESGIELPWPVSFGIGGKNGSGAGSVDRR